ncbi:MAG: F0F1 ATP synthase subunit epsilon [Deltaproteobacteria bacterium]|nr:F0F1 ATP synthase subunit epsilon [Deltaproteobacteria bacterium]
MGTLFLEVVTPDKVLVSQEVDMVVAPGAEGEFGVLPGHINFLTNLIPGELRFTYGDKREYLAVSNGFAEVSNDRVSILSDTAEKAGEIDIERAQKALERAQKRLEKGKYDNDIDFLRTELALKKAIVRIKVNKKSI